MEGRIFQRENKNLRDIKKLINILTDDTDSVLCKLEHKIEKNWKNDIDNKRSGFSEFFSGANIEFIFRG
jgi:hypothetical protein